MIAFTKSEIVFLREKLAKANQHVANYVAENATLLMVDIGEYN